MERDERIGVVGGYALFINEAGEIIGEPEWDVLDRGVINYCFFPFNRLWSGTTLIRKRCLAENNWRFEQRFFPADDYHMWLRLSLKCKIYLIPEPLYFYRIHGGNSSLDASGSLSDKVVEMHNMVLQDVLDIKFKIDFNGWWRWEIKSISEWNILVEMLERLSDLYSSLDFLTPIERIKVHFYYNNFIYEFWSANRYGVLEGVKFKDIVPYMRSFPIFFIYKIAKKISYLLVSFIYGKK